MASKGSYRYTTDDDGNMYVQRWGENRFTGKGSWHDQSADDGTPMREVPSDRTVGGDKMTDRNRNSQRILRAKLKSKARGYYIKGEGSKARAKEASEMGWFEGTGKGILYGAGRETDKLLTGAANIGDFLLDAFTPGGNPASGERTNQREKDQDSMDEMYAEFGAEHPMSTMVGGMAPYMVTGATAGPMSSRVGKDIVETVADKTAAGIQGTKSALGRGTEYLADKPGIVGEFGEELMERYVRPNRRKAMRKSKQKKYKDPYREGVLGEVLGGGILGAVEGGVHYDMNPIEGAVSSLIGGSTGAALSPHVSKAPNYWGENEQRLIDWGKDQGMQFTPGMEKGSRRLQKFEAGLRESGDYSDSMGQFDRANTEIMNDVAWEAAGVPKEMVGEMTPDRLGEWMTSLSDQYKKLELDTTGRMSKVGRKDIRRIVSDMESNKSPSGKKAYAVAKSYLDQMEIMFKPVRDARGRMTKATFTGKDYQTLRQAMKEDMDAAFNSDKPFIPKALKGMIDLLDKGLEHGMRAHGGKAKAQQWKDLNEKYAMTHLLLEKGVNSLGKLDPRKLGNHLMATDAKRTLLEKGGRIKDLQKLVKVDEMSRTQAGSGLSGSNMIPIRQSGKLSPFQALMQTPAGGMLPLVHSAYMSAYRKGWPSKTGLLNMDRKNKYWSPTKIARAAQQSAQPYPKVYDLVTKERGKEEEEEY